MSVEVANFRPFEGEHCENVAIGTLLRNLDIEFSEPMLFGLGEGLSFIFLNLATLPLPFLGGRVKPFEITKALCRNLNLELQVSETISKSKAWKLLEQPLESGAPVGLQLDSYYLAYFSNPVHFAGHFVAAYGFDDQNIFLVDTKQQGGKQQATRKSIEAARFAKGPMSARARTWTISRDGSNLDIAKATRTAIRSNAEAYLAPPFKGASYLGIEKLAASLPKWLDIATDPSSDFALASVLMEKAGTGGSLFRNFYRDFLNEAASELPKEATRLKDAQRLFADSAQLWGSVAENLEECGSKGSSIPLQKAATQCRQIRDLEVSAMKLLVALS